jgi:hypothetical protein
MLSPFRSPDEPAPSPPARPPPAPRAAPHYRYEQPHRRAATHVFRVSCAILVGVVAVVAYRVASAHELPSAWFERAGILALSVAWLSWLELRARFGLELHPESGMLLVLRCPSIPWASWTRVRDVALPAVAGVELRGLRGRRRWAVLVVRSWSGAESEVRLGPMRDERHIAALAHWVDQARVIVAKLEGPP